MKLNSAEELIEDIRQGKMVILMDDEDRENEGDLVMAASFVRAEDINFMASNGRGLICLTLTRQRCQQLNIPLMVNLNNAAHGTNFTISIEAAKGVTTGISAADRATTVQAAINANATPADIVQPGHIFPIMAKPGGVLTRAGHTEAGCDLARLAGLESAAVIVEILNADGTMARQPDLEIFAKEFDLKIGTIADLIRFRLENEKSLDRVGECALQNEAGDFRLLAYRNRIDSLVHYAIVKGDISKSEETLVRVHMPHYLNDVLGNFRSDGGWPLMDVMRKIESEGKGIVVLLSQQNEQEYVVQKIKEFQAEDEGGPKNKPQAYPDLRTFGIGAQILLDLGVRKMRVMSSPKILHGLSGFGLEVVEYISNN